MPRVHTPKAQKDYPNEGIKKGDVYYKWKTRPGGRGEGIIHRSATRPKPWQLTSSPFLQQQYMLEDQLQNLTLEDMTSDTRDEIAGEIRALGEECQESLDNMPESLQYAPSGEMLQERIDACEGWADEIEGVEIPDNELEDPGEEPGEPEEDVVDERERALEELQQCSYPG